MAKILKREDIRESPVSLLTSTKDLIETREESSTRLQVITTITAKRGLGLPMIGHHTDKDPRHTRY